MPRRDESNLPRPARRVTMSDVARAAGCSQAAVSFILNGRPGVRLSQETRDRVIEAARRLGYADAVPAAARQVGARRRIGFLVDRLAAGSGAVPAIEGAAEAGRGAGAIVLAAQTFGDAGLEAEAVRAFLDQKVAALAYMVAAAREIVLPRELADAGVPVFLLNGYTAEQTRPAVMPSEIAGAQRCTRHLIERGHRRIAVIAGDMATEAAQDRLKGYRRALSTADLPFDPDRVIEGDGSARAGYDATRRLLALPVPPTAVFCQTGRAASGCYAALREAGLSIPGDVSVVGYGGDGTTTDLHPRLTAVVLPFRAMGEWAVAQLDAVLPPLARYPVTKLECALVEGDSVAASRG